MFEGLVVQRIECHVLDQVRKCFLLQVFTVIGEPKLPYKWYLNDFITCLLCISLPSGYSIFLLYCNMFVVFNRGNFK